MPTPSMEAEQDRPVCVQELIEGRVVRVIMSTSEENPVPPRTGLDVFDGYDGPDARHETLEFKVEAQRLSDHSLAEGLPCDTG